MQWNDVISLKLGKRVNFSYFSDMLLDFQAPFQKFNFHKNFKKVIIPRPYTFGLNPVKSATVFWPPTLWKSFKICNSVDHCDWVDEYLSVFQTGHISHARWWSNSGRGERHQPEWWPESSTEPCQSFVRWCRCLSIGRSIECCWCQYWKSYLH